MRVRGSAQEVPSGGWPALHEGATYLGGVPYDYYRWLRDNEPIAYHARASGETGYWSVVRYEHVQAVSRDPQTFRSAPHPFFDESIPLDQQPRFGGILCLDGEQHTKLRRMVNHEFRPSRIRSATDIVASRVDQLISSMAGRCTADLASEFAALLPAHVLGDLLGIPERHRPKLFELMETSFGFDEGVSGARRFDATIALYAYIKKLCEKRYEHLEADLVSSILAEAPGGSEMSPMEMAGLVLVLLNAGTATTRNLISLGIRGLLEQRDQFDRLAGDPALISLAVEELLRYTSPLIQFTRTAAVDTELGGKGLAAGSKVVMIFASANRDERRFEDPDRIDVGRKPNEHLAFGGGGPHFCLGAPLARLEAGLAISAIVERLNGLELASSAPMTCFRSTTIHGLRTLPVRWESVVRGTQ